MAHINTDYWTVYCVRPTGFMLFACFSSFRSS